MHQNSLVLVGVLSVLGTAWAQEVSQPGVGPGPGMRYATDAYPGFDNEKEIVRPEKKTPRWFSWWNGPDCSTASEQLLHCRELESAGKLSKAVKQYDALVREWPSAPEAGVAQAALAAVLLREGENEEAFSAYRYLLDFYAIACDYNAVADTLYKLALLMRRDGKVILYFRFDNTVDVRRAFESCVLRAPGAKWAPAALLEIGELREEEGRWGKAVEVYENLRNLHPDTPEAKAATVREAAARMVLLRDHAYNRPRVQDTIDFLRQALVRVDEKDLPTLREHLAEAEGLVESEAFLAARFYDSRTRTVRSAISAYEKFLTEYPEGPHAGEARRRLEELKKEGVQ